MCILEGLREPPAERRLQVVQVFRGAAALLVVLFHATSIDKSYLQHEFLADFFMFGYGGVDFFFVLNGFVIVLAHGRDVGVPDRLRPYLVRH
jgi:exopolysaccharide production protein ExoZ